MLVSLTYLPGCVVIHSKADTILTLSTDTKDGASITLGFRDTTWAFVDDRLIIIGRGWHPREHETYAFFINEPYPAFQPRWLLVTPISSGKYEIVLWWWGFSLSNTVEEQGTLFKGTLQDVEWSQGKTLRLHLVKVLLSSPHHKIDLLLSGRIIAKAGTQSFVEERMRSRTEEIQKITRPP